MCDIADASTARKLGGVTVIASGVTTRTECDLFFHQVFLSPVFEPGS